MLALEGVNIQGQASRPPLLSFHSLQRSLVTPRCLELPRSGPSRFDGSTFVAVPAVFRCASGYSLPPRVPQTWPRKLDDAQSIRLRRRRGSCIAAFLLPAMFRYPHLAS